MKYHFKQALEEVKYFETPEGKAEYLLRKTIQAIRESRALTGIDEICFMIVGTFQNPTIYKIHSLYYRKGTIHSSSNLYSSGPIFDYNEIISIYQTIENKLRIEGFDPKDADLNLDNNKYYQIIKSFRFKI